jgi:hypothetical protein
MATRMPWLGLACVLTCGCAQIFGFEDWPDDAGAKNHGCASRPPTRLFCADFDGVTQPEQGWDGKDVHGANLQLDSLRFVSSPKSLKAMAQAAGDMELAQLTHTLSGSFDHLVIDFMLVVDTLPEGPELKILELASDVNDYSLGLVVSSDPHLEEYPSNGYPSVNAKLPVTQWTEVKLDVSFSSHSVTFSLDGHPSAPINLNSPSAISDPKLAIGLVYVPPAGPGWSIGVDDVFISR